MLIYTAENRPAVNASDLTPPAAIVEKITKENESAMDALKEIERRVETDKFVSSLLLLLLLLFFLLLLLFLFLLIPFLLLFLHHHLFLHLFLHLLLLSFSFSSFSCLFPL